jgi:hypothetical protein
MSINTLDNKKLLWSTLQTNRCFEGLDDNTFSPVKQHFETVIEQTDKKYKSKINKNKEVLSDMIGFIKNVKAQQEMKTPTPRPVQQLTPQPELTPKPEVTPQPESTPQPSITIRDQKPTAYKREDMQTQRQQMFEERLKKRQAEFTSLLHGNKPEPIDFADKNEDNPELVGNILKESENFVKQRELDLAQQETQPEKQQEKQQEAQQNKKPQNKESKSKTREKVKKQDLSKRPTTMSAGEWLSQKAIKFLKIDNTPTNSETAQREKENIVIDLSEKQPEKQPKKKVSFQNVKHIIEEDSPTVATIKTKLVSPPPVRNNPVLDQKLDQKLDLILESVKSLQNQINELKSETTELKTVTTNIKTTANDLKATTDEIKLNQIEQSVSAVSDSVIETVLENMKTRSV